MSVYKKTLIIGWHVIIYIIFLSPHIVKTIPALDFLFTYCKLLLLLYSVARVVLSKKINSIILLSVLIFCMVAISTLINKDNVSSVFGRYYTMVAVMFFLQVYNRFIYRELKSIFYASEILIVLNTIFILIFPSGIYINITNNALYWIIGQKQDFGIVFIVAAASGMILWRENRIRKHIMMVYVMMIFNMISAPSLGLIICLIFFIALSFATYSQKIFIKGKYLLFINIICELIILGLTAVYKNLTALQIFLGRISMMGVSKADTISSRVNMWADSIDLIQSSPLIGVGYISQDRYYNITHYSLYHPVMHNQILDFGVTGGLIAITLFLIINIVVFQKLDRYKGRTRDILTFAIFSSNILMLTECMYWPFTFALYLIGYNIGNIEYNFQETKKSM